MLSNADRERQLKIKSGIVKRINKEMLMYSKEAVAQQSRIDKMIAEGQDSHEVKQQEKVLLETTDILPDCKKRLAVAYGDLDALLTNEYSESVVSNLPEKESLTLSAARTILEEASSNV